uniref:Uncharacterized protein n=1 Tax=viral metagenome TaxID=1070528 RepID=A0A6C0BKY5_9ZZZZ
MAQFPQQVWRYQLVQYIWHSVLVRSDVLL